MRLPTNESDDPLTRALAPPPNETAEERAARVKKEIEAQRVSDEIDEAIKLEKNAQRKKRAMRMLLLGQSESGKSTTLKNMQLAYAPRTFAAERVSWRAVIQLNLVRSINAVLDALSSELSPVEASSKSSYLFGSSGLSKPPSPGPEPGNSSGILEIPQDRRAALMKLKLRLAPLRQVEADLKARLGAGTEEITEATLGTLRSAEGRGSMDAENALSGLADDGVMPCVPSRKPNPKEVFVRSHRDWKEKEKARTKLSLVSLNQSSRPVSPGFSLDLSDRDSATDVLAGCAEDMESLWRDSVVSEIVKHRKVMSGLWDSADYFLASISRIASRDYEPTNDDVLRARIRTLGVQEYTIPFETSGESPPPHLGFSKRDWHEWKVYDVGGSRTSRAAWIPYFTDVHAVLFLAPISAFDERLAEDKRVNRLEDTFLLWQEICKNELLKNAVIILFMNKCDILKRKLEAGVQVNKHMTSYGARDNEVTAFAKYIQHKFKELLISLSPEKRMFYGFLTTVIDATATAKTLASVRDGILQANLRNANFVA
ncbi:guanine nucleotide binding protein, alpha subunit [Irpex rosettiformis]|uniref:Guanine nucleotide binding protein, alpha subunit n=1 Tax=Irpex rosettiformis TaxID=378272 RepID=A0ACB8U4N0_9APHY|nr:guanine nucleotide binding protein, alpha subunit [Irpex rosettiformis]